MDARIFRQATWRIWKDCLSGWCGTKWSSSSSACRARAIIQGRLAPSVDDVVALAGPILRHRMAVNFSARAEGITVETVISQMCARLG